MRARCFDCSTRHCFNDRLSAVGCALGQQCLLLLDMDKWALDVCFELHGRISFSLCAQLHAFQLKSASLLLCSSAVCLKHALCLLA